MRYEKAGVVVEASGGWDVLEKLGFRSELQVEYQEKRERRMAIFKERLAQRWSCPECGKEMSAIARNKHHASHQGGR